MDAILFGVVPVLVITAIWLIYGYIKIRFTRLWQKSQKMLDDITQQSSFKNFTPLIWKTKSRRLKK
jgi:hypothetical protein